MKKIKLAQLAMVLLLVVAVTRTAWANDNHLKGTSLAPDAKGGAEVKRKHGESRVEFKVKNLPPANGSKASAAGQTPSVSSLIAYPGRRFDRGGFETGKIF